MMGSLAPVARDAELLEGSGVIEVEEVLRLLG